MEQLIFFGVIILFSILESVARSRKARQRAEGGEAPAEPERFEWAQRSPGEARLPTYDQDPSYDDRVGAEEAPRAPARSPRQPEPPSAAPPGGAETVADLWAEIAGLARGQTQERPRPVAVPRQSPPLPAKVPRRPAQTAARVPAPPPPPAPRTVAAARPAPAEHAVHLSHAGYGTDPSERSKSEQDDLDPLAERLGLDVAAARALLLGGGSPVRQAMILQEVLGPPASMRYDR